MVDKLTGDRIKGLLPLCIVEYLRNKWPSPAGVYHGYPFSSEELILMGEDPEEYYKQEEITLKEMKQARRAKERLEQDDKESAAKASAKTGEEWMSFVWDVNVRRPTSVSVLDLTFLAWIYS